jgi:hypothetical protein
MKILDERGRLFGKINIVDFLIVVFLVIIIPVFFHVYKILGKRPTWVPSKWVRVEAVSFTLPEIAELLAPGQTSYAYGEPQAKIVNVLKKDEKYSENLKSAMRKKSLPQYEYRIPVFLELDLLCTHSAENEPYYFQRNPLLVSMERTHSFKADRRHIRFYVLKFKD